MEIKELKRTEGNFEGYNTRDFPLDCNGMAAMQLNERLLSIIGNIGGDKYIISGDNTQGYYVFLATKFAPQGELLYLKPFAGSSPNVISLKTNPIDIIAQNRDYSGAYVERWLEFGLDSGNGQFNWSEFTQIKTNRQLAADIEEVRDMDKSPVPKGVITMWSGTIETIPSGWLLCDGNNGTPDLKGRFVVGYYNGDNDYGIVGNKTSLDKTKKIDVNHLPSHDHPYQDTFMVERFSQNISEPNEYYPYNAFGTKGGVDFDNNRRVWYNRNTSNNATSHQGFDIRPPYYVLAYIIKI